MTEQPVFECDDCGERYGYLNEMRAIPMRYAPSDPLARREDQHRHVCITCGPESLSALLDLADRLGYTYTAGDANVEALLIDDEWRDVEEVTQDARYDEDPIVEAIDYIETEVL